MFKNHTFCASQKFVTQEDFTWNNLETTIIKWNQVFHNIPLDDYNNREAG